jgi:hypothetical protein
MNVDRLVMTTLQLTSPSHIYTSETERSPRQKEARNL